MKEGNTMAYNLGDLRRARNMSQWDLSMLSGVKLTALQCLEQGRNDIRGAKAETVVRLARALGVTAEDLIDIDDTDATDR